MSFITQTITKCGYRDIEELIKEVYNQKVELVAEMGWNNYSKYSFTVDKCELEEDVFLEYDKEDFDMFIAGETMSADFGACDIIEAILADLAAKGHIPYGELYVEVFW